MVRTEKVPLGLRGRATRGEHAGRWVIVDVAGMTPVDPLVVVTSEDLDQPGHPSEQAVWINPEDLDQRLAHWRIEWTDVVDDATARRYGP